MLYLILFSNIFILKLFFIYLEINNFIKNLNNINFGLSFEKTAFTANIKNNKIKNFIHSEKKKFSTFTKNLYLNTENKDLDFEPELPNNPNNSFSLDETKAVKEFKIFSKGGYLGYNHIYHIGNISEFGHLTDLNFQDYYFKLQDKIIEFFNELPTEITYCVLPVLR
jgi:hypothetical protein